MGRARQLASRGNNDSILLDASAASTDVGERILLDGTDASSSNAGFFITTEDETNQNFNLDLNGDKQIVLDADGDTAIYSTSDDLATIKVAGQPRVAVDAYGQLTFYSDDNEVSPTTKATIYNTDSALNIYAASNSSVDKGIAFHTSSDGGSSALAIGGAAASDVNIKTGDLLFGTAGKGVNLGVTSNTDANTLDDYEEGTWTATITCLTSGTVTLNGSYNTGYYTKVGRVCTFSYYIFTSAISSPQGALAFNLPFTAVDNGLQNGSVKCQMDGLGGADATSHPIGNVWAQVINNAAKFNIYDWNGTAATSTNANWADIDASTGFHIMGHYVVA